MSQNKKAFLVSKKTWFSLFLTALLFGTIAITQIATVTNRDNRSKAACTTSGSFNFDNPTSIGSSWGGWDGHYYIYVYKLGQTINEAIWTLHYTSISGSRTFIPTSAVLEGGTGYQATIYLHQTSNLIVWATVGFNSDPCPLPPPPPPPASVIILSGSTFCSGGGAYVRLTWTSNTGEVNYNIVKDGTAITSGPNPWTSSSEVSGQNHNWQIQGAVTSNAVSITTASGCVVNPPPVAVNPPPVAVNPPPVAVNPPPVAVNPPPVAVNPPPVAVNPPPVAVNPPPPSGGGCILIFCGPPPPPPPPPLVKKPVQPSGPKVTPPGVALEQPAGVDDITLKFAPNPYLQGGMEVTISADGTSVSQKVVVEKAGGTFVLKTSALSKNSIYKMKVSSKNSLVNVITFTYVNNTSVDVPTFITGDFNGDNVINETDLTKLVPGGMVAQDSLYDINYDGVVNSVDYAILLANLGKNGQQ